MPVVLQMVDLQGAGIGVHQPQVRHTLAGVDGHLQGAVGARGGRGEDLTGPVRGELEPGRLRQLGHALTAPAGDVGDDDVATQMELGLVEDPPRVLRSASPSPSAIVCSITCSPATVPFSRTATRRLGPRHGSASEAGWRGLSFPRCVRPRPNKDCVCRRHNCRMSRSGESDAWRRLLP